MHNDIIDRTVDALALNETLPMEAKRRIVPRLLAVRPNLCREPECWMRCPVCQRGLPFTETLDSPPSRIDVGA